MKIVLSVHILPNELGKYNILINELGKCLQTIKSDIQISFYSTLNLNEILINWSSSYICKQKCIDQYEAINNNIQLTKKICRFTEDKNYLGVNDHRRDTIKKYKDYDSIIFLDSDIRFQPTILNSHIEALGKINTSTYYIISPQTIKLWDGTWDCLVNDKYINESYTFYKEIDASKISSTNHGEINLIKNNTFKWGGGWFNAISPELLSLVNIPKSFIGYGPDDTFLMMCCKLLHSRGYDVQQYILENEVVMESQSNKNQDPFAEIKLNKLTSTFRRNGEQFFGEELRKFTEKL